MAEYNITGLTFDQSSKLALQEIRYRKKLFKALKMSIGGGTIINIFLGSKSYEAAWNIYSTDFKTMAQAVRSVGAIQRRVVSGIAWRQALRHTGKEAMFWEGIHDALER